jgi:excisionase family DNA binding protein
MNDRILSAEQAASMLDLSESAVYRLLQQGEIPGAKIGGQWRVRQSDLERAFDLARARATAQQREKASETEWGAALEKLRSSYPNERFVLTRCAWCPEFVPAWEGARFTTLCSGECAAELRGAMKLLGWPIDTDLTLSPIYRLVGGLSDGSELLLDARALVAEVQYGIAPDHDLTSTRDALRHERGPLRELLLLEHPVMRARFGHQSTQEVPIVPGATPDGARNAAESG